MKCFNKQSWRVACKQTCLCVAPLRKQCLCFVWEELQKPSSVHPDSKMWSRRRFLPSVQHFSPHTLEHSSLLSQCPLTTTYPTFSWDWSQEMVCIIFILFQWCKVTVAAYTKERICKRWHFIHLGETQYTENNHLMNVNDKASISDTKDNEPLFKLG